MKSAKRISGCVAVFAGCGRPRVMVAGSAAAGKSVKLVVPIMGNT
jgi:hypothetical protein